MKKFLGIGYSVWLLIMLFVGVLIGDFVGGVNAERAMADMEKPIAQVNVAPPTNADLEKFRARMREAEVKSR